MPPRKRSTQADDKAPELVEDAPRHERALREQGVDPAGRRETFTYVSIVPGHDGRAAGPGPDTAAVQAAVNAGYRPTGDAKVAGPVDHEDGESLVYTWSVPVLKVK